MEQLKMYWLKGSEIPQPELPDGYSVSTYKDESDKLAWVECCKNGLVSDKATAEDFDRIVNECGKISYEDDVFFLNFNGERIGTITAILLPGTKIGLVHMVGIKTEFRGKGLGKFLNAASIKRLAEQDVDYIRLTTDEHRKGAVKSYLSSGFKPVEYADGMQARWEAVLADYGIDSIDMLNEDGSFCKKIYKAE